MGQNSAKGTPSKFADDKKIRPKKFTGRGTVWYCAVDDKIREESDENSTGNGLPAKRELKYDANFTERGTYVTSHMETTADDDGRSVRTPAESDAAECSGETETITAVTTQTQLIVREDENVADTDAKEIDCVEVDTVLKLSLEANCVQGVVESQENTPPNIAESKFECYIKKDVNLNNEDNKPVGNKTELCHKDVFPVDTRSRGSCSDTDEETEALAAAKSESRFSDNGGSTETKLKSAESEDVDSTNYNYRCSLLKSVPVDASEISHNTQHNWSLHTEVGENVSHTFPEGKYVSQSSWSTECEDFVDNRASFLTSTADSSSTTEVWSDSDEDNDLKRVKKIHSSSFSLEIHLKSRDLMCTICGTNCHINCKKHNEAGHCCWEKGDKTHLFCQKGVGVARLP